MNQPMDMQTMMLALQNFWGEKGCLIWQPYHTEVGAGTMNPGTFLRVLGPEPWNVAYVEPSIRQDDGRYGENPNRLYQHYQFQVILKPDPGNPQEIYLDSLAAIGIDLANHDIRFVEDNWQSPVLGAWGLGWQVWMDGQEITQFTYFQQAGGLNLDPVSVEITYGLDRIAMSLQRVHDFKDIRWDARFKYGDVKLQAEQENSKYAFEIASVDRLRTLFEIYEAEAQASLEKMLVLPAQDYLLKCSNTFNTLDARGAVGVTERQAYFGRMRDLARQVAVAYTEQRQRLEYPFFDRIPEGQTISDLGSIRRKPEPIKQPVAVPLTGPADFVLEIGTEELPPYDLQAGLDQLEIKMKELLLDVRLAHSGLEVFGTPRRLVVSVKNLAARQDDLEQEVKGPPAARAYDAVGNPTKAAQGFARSKGIQVDELAVREIDGGEYIVALVREAGRPAGEVLGERLSGVVGALRFDKSMRWNQTNIAFSRPVRWLLALHGEHVVPYSYAGLQSGRTTRGLRTSSPAEFAVDDPAAYFAALESQGIVLDVETRQAGILAALKALAVEVGGELSHDPALLAVVTNEVEAPATLRGSFDVEFLDLPREVLVAVMKKHQNYFPVERDGQLLPYFAAVCNGGQQDMAVVTQGNEDVIRARFADGAFFIAEDRKRNIEDFLPVLKTLTFQADLGSMWDKSERIGKLVEALVEMLQLSPEVEETVRRASVLCKADLVSNMVVEMTSLQGIMGRYYALDSGETAAVAAAIEEHYLPRFAGDKHPESVAGFVVGLADRLDSLVGLFAAGLAPSGTKDPFAQRRAALGIVGNLIARDQEFDLRIALANAAANLPIEASPAALEATLAFIVERLRNQLLDGGFRHDIVDAVVLSQGHNPTRAAYAVSVLTEWVARDDWRTILPAYARCVRITRDLTDNFEVAPAVFVEPSTKDLFAALQQAETAPRRPGSMDDFLNAFLPMIPSIDRFFDDVLVMAEEPALRQARLGVLQRIAGLAEGVADMSRLEGF